MSFNIYESAKKNIIVVAHRGASGGNIPCNTLTSYEIANSDWSSDVCSSDLEETNANDMITKMELFGSDPKSLYMLNQELAARVYTAPSLVL